MDRVDPHGNCRLPFTDNENDENGSPPEESLLQGVFESLCLCIGTPYAARAHSLNSARVLQKWCYLCDKAKKMNTKLTLTMEQSIIEKAKRYARERERSLSDLIENYLRALIEEKAKDEKDLSPTVKQLRGSFTLPEGFDYKKEITDILSKKYL